MPAIRRPQTTSVQEDWAAWLPSETAQLFEHLRDDLALSCAILAVIVNEALDDSSSSNCTLPQQLAPLFVGLVDRLVCHLGVVLSALEDHGRQCGTLPHAAPLRPEHFRGDPARQLARASRLRSRLRVPGRSMFWHKMCAVRNLLTGLQIQARDLAQQIELEESSGARDQWIRLELLQYDLNTCLQETIVLLKSFLCALPGNELPLFRNRLPV